MRRRLSSLLTAAIVGTVVVGFSGADIDPAGAAVVSVPGNIDATGRDDVTDELNNFLDGVAPGATVSFPTNARYRVEGVLVLLNKDYLTLEGNGTTFFATTDGRNATPPRRGFRAYWPRRRVHLDIRRGFGITLRNFTIDGANPKAGARPDAYVAALEGQAGIALARSSAIIIDAVTITDTYGDAVWITGGTNNVTIRNSTFARIGRQGVAVVSGHNITIEDNDIREVARSVFDLEPIGRKTLAQSVFMRRNRIGPFRNFLLAAGGGGPGVNDIWLEENRVVDTEHGLSVYAGHALQRRWGLHILNNTGTGSADPVSGEGLTGLFQLTNLDGVEIRGNVQGVAEGPVMYLDRVCNLTVEGNQFPGASAEREEIRACGEPLPLP